VSDLSN